MPALPSRNIRNIKTDRENSRPRDEAIKKAANDNYRPSFSGSVTKNYTKKIAAPANDNLNPAYPSVDQEFNASYAKAGLQPTTSYPDFTRNVKKSGEIADDESMGEFAPSNIYQGRYNEPVRQVNAEYRQLPVTQSGEVTRGLQITNLVVKKADDRLQRLKITRVNGLIFWPSVGFWATFQLPLAVISLISFAFAAYVKDLLTSNDTGNPLVNILKAAGSSILEAVAIVLRIEFDPADVYYLTAAATFFIGAGMMIVISVIYTLSSVRFFSGQGAALKIFTYVLAFFCYLIPFFSIFPWHLLWMATVWRYPK